MTNNEHYELEETSLYNLNSGPETLVAIGKTFDFISLAVSAMPKECPTLLDCSAEGLSYLLQHLKALIIHAAADCDSKITSAEGDIERLKMFEKLHYLYADLRERRTPDTNSNSLDEKDLLEQVSCLEKQLLVASGNAEGDLTAHTG